MKTINVQDQTYERFTEIIKKMVIANKGTFITQDQAVTELLNNYKPKEPQPCPNTTA